MPVLKRRVLRQAFVSKGIIWKPYLFFIVDISVNSDPDYLYFVRACLTPNTLNELMDLFYRIRKWSFICRSSPGGGQSSFHVQTTLLVFQCCAATGVLECMFLEILQKLAKLHSTEDVLLIPKNSIL